MTSSSVLLRFNATGQLAFGDQVTAVCDHYGREDDYKECKVRWLPLMVILCLQEKNYSSYLSTQIIFRASEGS